MKKARTASYPLAELDGGRPVAQEYAMKLAFCSLGTALKRFAYLISLLAPVPVPQSLLRAVNECGDIELNDAHLIPELEKRFFLRRVSPSRVLLHSRLRNWIRANAS